MRSKVQELARLAYECVKQVKDEAKKMDEKGKDFASRYLSYTKKLPSMIIYNGLLTTVAFAKAKAKKASTRAKVEEGEKVNIEGLAWEKLLEHLKEFLRREGINQDNKDLIEFLSKREVQEYRFITKRVLDFSLWLKRIAEGEIEDEGKGD
ncbi:MAG: type III-B CRISPR module-associated protein Cmr5 [Thermocrinis sp.]|jgi:CRISPR-associated protein Cmr5|uniref:type III-B CRISPR module-associated protein Cmr5 n=1 Tax=Thermocrinis sp. TaxID=2024383 RepID=UPI003C0DB4A8